MCMAERIATGSRPRVLEDGPDTVNSDDEAKADVVPDEEHGMYTPEMDPKLGPKKISQQEAARQRAAAQALKANPGSQLSSESDNPAGFDMRWSRSRQTFVKNAAKDLSDSEVGNSIVGSCESSRQPTPMNSDEDDMTEDQRRVAASAKKKAARSQPPRCLSAAGTKAQSKPAPAPAQ
jgi:hypothetical protein